MMYKTETKQRSLIGLLLGMGCLTGQIAGCGPKASAPTATVTPDPALAPAVRNSVRPDQDFAGQPTGAGQSASLSDLGIPLYPGSTASTQAGAGSTVSARGLTMTLRETSDSVAQVAAFYKEKLIVEAGSKTIAPTVRDIERDGKAGVSLSSVGGPQGVRNVRVLPGSDGKTLIEIMRLRPHTGATGPTSGHPRPRTELPTGDRPQ